MVPYYMGQRVSKTKIKNDPPEIESKWITSAKCFHLKTINILETAVVYNDNWTGKSIEITIQMDQDSLEKLPNVIHLKNGQSLYVVAEGKKTALLPLRQSRPLNIKVRFDAKKETITRTVTTKTPNK
uniref:Uncharacterized protein n=1 Tax=Octopus bimaculoides TaxID=37653 RepID=A0A0L8GVP4_OCTBM